jgi:hypothetical protein
MSYALQHVSMDKFINISFVLQLKRKPLLPFTILSHGIEKASQVSFVRSSYDSLLYNDNGMFMSNQGWSLNLTQKGLALQTWNNVSEDNSTSKTFLELTALPKWSDCTYLVSIMMKASSVQMAVKLVNQTKTDDDPIFQFGQGQHKSLEQVVDLIVHSKKNNTKNSNPGTVNNVNQDNVNQVNRAALHPVYATKCATHHDWFPASHTEQGDWPFFIPGPRYQRRSKLPADKSKAGAKAIASSSNMGNLALRQDGLDKDDDEFDEEEDNDEEEEKKKDNEKSSSESNIHKNLQKSQGKIDVLVKNMYISNSGVDIFPGAQLCQSNAECIEKQLVACTKRGNCGHLCQGYVNEPNCLPCLKPSCASRAVTQAKLSFDLPNSEEICSICGTAELGECACIQMSCGHIFHYSCMHKRITSKRNSKRLTFQSIDCPLCRKTLSHSDPEIMKLIQPQISLREKVKAKAMERLIFEGLEKDPRIVNPSSEFYNKPDQYAMHHFQFFQCSSCLEPYFAGAAECGEAPAPANDHAGPNADNNFEEVDEGANLLLMHQEMKCANCVLDKSIERCSKHGTDWLSFKCRFCCKLSVWYCFGGTHFCEGCHNNWNALVESDNKNKKKLHLYTQCAGLRRKIEEVMRDQSLTAKARERILENMVSDPDTCPLKMRHPLNGKEYSSGCGMCLEDKMAAAEVQAGKEAKKAIADAKEEKDAKVEQKAEVKAPEKVEQKVEQKIELQVEEQMIQRKQEFVEVQQKVSLIDQELIDLMAREGR